jgi:MSHA pilin protein MshD
MYLPTIRLRQNGLTLIELIMFIAVVSIGVAGILSVMNYTTQRSADPMVQKQALAVAESLLEEIQLKAFANPPDGFSGGVTQAERPEFDDVLDYDGFTTTGVFPADGGGSVIAGLEDFNVVVAVAQNAGGELGIAGPEALGITVTVTHPSGNPVALTGYRTNY